jgi:hypothetical protein
MYSIGGTALQNHIRYSIGIGTDQTRPSLPFVMGGTQFLVQKAMLRGSHRTSLSTRTSTGSGTGSIFLPDRYLRASQMAVAHMNATRDTRRHSYFILYMLSARRSRQLELEVIHQEKSIRSSHGSPGSRVQRCTYLSNWPTDRLPAFSPPRHDGQLEIC